MQDMIHEECGVFGIYDKNMVSDVVSDTYYGLFALQHRGQESCGIAVNDRGVITAHKDVGLVRDVFDQHELDKLGKGQMAIGHTRYSTFGTVNHTNAQPLLVRHIKGQLAIAHNGNLTNAAELREELEQKGAIFHTTNDSEIICYIIIQERLKTSSIEKAIENTMNRIEGAYSLVVMSPEKLIAVRDKKGFRPLVMGKDKDGRIVFASETCAFAAVGVDYVRDIDAGEIVVIDHDGVEHSIRTHCKEKPHMCVFEYVYFARSDSILQHQPVHEARRNAGRILAKEHPVEADVVIGVPDSGLDAAQGYAEESGIPYGMGFIKNRYIARTFIQPTQGQRENAVNMKLHVISSVVKDKRVIMVDDSIVRGTTSGKIVHLLRNAGAREIHVCISSPPITDPCYYGIDTSVRKELISATKNIEEICAFIGADSLHFISLEGLRQCVPALNPDHMCYACFNNNYPVPEEDATLDEDDKLILERRRIAQRERGL